MVPIETILIRYTDKYQQLVAVIKRERRNNIIFKYLHDLYYIVSVGSIMSCLNGNVFFSWHEVGLYDLPALIDFVRNATNQNAIYYIATSQGTTAFYVMAALRPEYNAYIKIMVALAPVAYMGYTPNKLLRFTGSLEKFCEVSFNYRGQSDGFLCGFCN